MEDNKKDDSVVTIIITVFAVIIIIVLAFLFYYYAEKSRSLGAAELASLSGYQAQPLTDTSNFTKVISFQPSEILPSTIMSGNCWTNSIAQPYRKDAFRCMVENSIYDPCFTTNQEGFVFCQMNPLKAESFLIKLTEALPVVEIPDEKQNNWAWFVKLKDGTYCSPYTGTRPFVDDKIAYYGCV
jgi:flagellar basal body-associated protein FliL